MQGLLPIIRRQRRPLLPVDPPPVAVVNVEPVKAEATLAEAPETKAVKGKAARAAAKEKAD